RGCATGQPRVCASCLTGEACSLMPRPAGRSGWVSTSTMSKPAASIASSAVRANAGVPAKAIFTLLGPVDALVAAAIGPVVPRVVARVVAPHDAGRIDVHMEQPRRV